ncbi:MAG TPA: hypothetical protein VMX76_02470 [Nevskiaceae bacterium]|nr:hypothetical protein [Nevskiaceae bacterium]
MKTSDPQFIYIALVLPTLFGLILVAEGLNKVLKEEKQGWVSLVLGFIFIGIVIFGYLFLVQNLL